MAKRPWDLRVAIAFPTKGNPRWTGKLFNDEDGSVIVTSQAKSAEALMDCFTPWMQREFEPSESE